MNPKNICQASLATLFTASTLDAAILHFDTIHLLTSASSTVDTDWDIDADGFTDAKFNAASIYSGGRASFRVHVNSALSSSLFKFNPASSISSNLSATRSIYGATHVSAFLNASGPIDGLGFADGHPGYIGFQFKHGGTVDEINGRITGGIIVYGWAEIVLSSASTAVANHGGAISDYPSGHIEIRQWAFEDTGASILAGDTGAIPEPSNAALGLGLLALGAAGLRRGRWLKHNSNADSSNTASLYK